MDAHWNKQSYYSFIPQALLMLFCVAICFSLPASAVAAGFSFFQQQAAQYDENGRSSQDRAMRSTPAPEAPSQPTDDLNRPCDQDDCSRVQGAGREQQGQPSTEEGGVQTVTQQAARSLQIQAGAPVNSMHIDGAGDVGFGTEIPHGRLHVVAKPGEDDAGDIFLLDKNGNLEIGGLLTEASSVLLKENFAAVDGQDVLARLVRIPITTWNYKADDIGIRHMGPMAQDFYAAFGLGNDAEHLAPLDANGVALVAVQTLSQQLQAQAAQIATLEAQNAALLQRLQALEARIQEHDE